MKRKRLTITLSKDVLSGLDSFIDGDKIRNRSHAIELILSEKLKSKPLTKAIILGGGAKINFKNKLISKLLLPLKGETLLEHNIEFLKKNGIKEIIFSLGEFGEDIREKIKDGSQYGIKVVYFERDRGNAEILKKAESLLDNTFLMMNGDIVLDSIDLLDFYNYHKKTKGLTTIAVTSEADPSSLGLVVMRGTNILDFKEKPGTKDNNVTAAVINAGIYIMEPGVCNLLDMKYGSLENDIFPRLSKGGELHGYHLSSQWIHLDNEEDYKKYIKSIENI